MWCSHPADAALGCAPVARGMIEMSVSAISSALSGISGGVAPSLGRVLASIEAKQIAPVQRIIGRGDREVRWAADGADDSATEDTVELSHEALEASDAEEAKSKERGSDELTEEERAQVDELKARDREVRQHEQAHLSAAGGYAQGGASCEYQVGPDGHRYAIGGEVSIDTTPIEGDPAATIAKMQQVQAAALAPADPSAQDRRVAAAASAAIQEARSEQIEQDKAERVGQEAEDSADTSAAGDTRGGGVVDQRFAGEPQPAALVLDVYA